MLKILLCIFISYSATSQDIYKTPSGTKYHLASCRMVENTSEKITGNEAQKLGLQPCKICKPDKLSLSVMNSASTAHGQGETVQCKGVTKAGSRCKHMTRIANGYCSQHTPDKN